MKEFSTGCCFKKKVGGENYTLISEDDTTGYDCTTNCVYGADSAPGTKICFKPGNQQVQCLEGLLKNNVLI